MTNPGFEQASFDSPRNNDFYDNLSDIEQHRVHFNRGNEPWSNPYRTRPQSVPLEQLFAGREGRTNNFPDKHFRLSQAQSTDRQRLLGAARRPNSIRRSGNSTNARPGALFRSSDDSSDAEEDNPFVSQRENPPRRESNTTWVRENRDNGPSERDSRGGIESAIRIGRIVNSWKISFPKTEKDPEQFLLMIRDQLDASGIDKNLFIPYLSSIFEGSYRAWYLLNRGNWRTWKDFSRAFRFQWSVRKDDSILLLEANQLKLDKSETLAEFTCRARLIYERMRVPPPFREQLQQILIKVNPALTFEILNLPIDNYEDFLHYINKRKYILQCSSEIRREARFSSNKSNMKVLKEDTDTSDEESKEEEQSSDQDQTNLDAIQQSPSNKPKQRKTSDSSKTLTQQRLEKNLTHLDKNEKARNKTSQTSTQRQKDNLDPSKYFCYNCGEKGHSSRRCSAERKEKICHVCQTIGHVNKDCPKMQGNEQARQ